MCPPAGVSPATSRLACPQGPWLLALIGCLGCARPNPAFMDVDSATVADLASAADLTAPQDRPWIRRDLPAGPPPLESPALAYDEARSETVLFGGSPDPTTGTDETWTWSGTGWKVRTPAARPTGRFRMAAAYDRERKVFVLFGGCPTGPNDCGKIWDETWEWSGDTWTRRTDLPAHPTGRFAAAMAYDAVRRRMVMFGGCLDAQGTVLSDETWEYEGTTWTRASPADHPGVLGYAAMAYDETRQVVLLHGGSQGSGVSNDTWTYDGVTWRRQTGGGGTRRTGHAMAYSPADGKVLLFGGASPRGDDSVSAWDGRNWQELAIPPLRPAARHLHGMAFDTRQHRLVLSGGWDDAQNQLLTGTWELPR